MKMKVSYSVAVVGRPGIERKRGVLKVANVILVDSTSMGSDKATQNISPLPSHFSAPTPQLVRLNQKGCHQPRSQSSIAFYIDILF